MYDMTVMITDFLQQNKTEGNFSNPKDNAQVTPQDTDDKKGNRSNLGNQEKLSNEVVNQMFIHAAQASGLMAEQLWSFLDDSDIDDLLHHLIDQETLTVYAKSWARYPETVPEGNTQPFPTHELKPKTVACKQCQNFMPDKIGDGTGIGHCSVNAPASKKGSLWLNTEVICNKYKTTA
ncbi:hypothetical protein AU255_05015 [Methyloprofundus sedimenti]|uniref:Uncharacterized protein n=1 Tax=Methyloprofundus sedimenti TaxID=1420851 RepID=A0A1V8M6T2_9GAMM|nr:hypothetical protein [Methyloprofundus sedimenti]OQK17255.1 hypothetical protein AU255_05015 [Methyloprofundus sedimenti]